ncbi:MAG: FKBP-type peptidyl-prolyl cis-trans isomerase [Bacteroidales bacterium]|nr:FKBP-type peptidyl-prolyl cis-trans isomerase [Bacteroidales bacterium]
MNELSYSLGVSVGYNLKEQGFKVDSIEDFSKALYDVLNENQLAIPQEKIGKLVNDYFKELQEKRSVEKNEDNTKFLAENAKRDGVVTLPSGLQYEIINIGDGEKPKLNDKVTTHYHGTLINGTIFDSSVKRGQPASFPVNGVIKGWTEALQLMPVGSKWKLFVPSELAYGEQGAGNAIGPNTTLIFEVELLSIDK